MEKTDSDLVIAHKKGDEQAFAELASRYMRRVYGFAYRLVGDDSLAEDATSETFIKAWRHIDSFDESKSFAAWVFAIARNATFDILRKRKDVAFSRFADRDAEDDMGDSVVDEADLPDINFDRGISRDILEKSLAQLSPVRRSIVLLHDTDDLTFEEIAKVMDMPMNTAKSHYRRALKALRAMLEGKDV
ncbi:MAG TPA: sigma-70 family RNA polymerase sigma factor [Candidatus Paceibacterota bacterium]